MQLSQFSQNGCFVLARHELLSGMVEVATVHGNVVEVSPIREGGTVLRVLY